MILPAPLNNQKTMIRSWKKTRIFPRWWFQRFFIFTPKIPILTNIFQMG